MLHLEGCGHPGPLLQPDHVDEANRITSRAHVRGQVGQATVTKATTTMNMGTVVSAIPKPGRGPSADPGYRCAWHRFPCHIALP